MTFTLVLITIRPSKATLPVILTTVLTSPFPRRSDVGGDHRHGPEDVGDLLGVRGGVLHVVRRTLLRRLH